jgi:hypothetical protein
LESNGLDEFSEKIPKRLRFVEPVVLASTVAQRMAWQRSRAGLITGRYQQRWCTCWYGQGGRPDREITLPEALSTAGSVTAKFGETHLNGLPMEFPTLIGAVWMPIGTQIPGLLKPKRTRSQQPALTGWKNRTSDVGP